MAKAKFVGFTCLVIQGADHARIRFGKLHKNVQSSMRQFLRLGEHEREKLAARKGARFIEHGHVKILIEVDLAPLPGLHHRGMPGLERLSIQAEMRPGGRAFHAVPAIGQQDSANIEKNYVEGEHCR